MEHVAALCCFCGKVRDEGGTAFGQGAWGDLPAYRTAYQLESQDLLFSHTYCQDCYERCMTLLRDGASR